MLKNESNFAPSDGVLTIDEASKRSTIVTGEIDVIKKLLDGHAIAKENGQWVVFEEPTVIKSQEKQNA